MSLRNDSAAISFLALVVGFGPTACHWNPTADNQRQARAGLRKIERALGPQARGGGLSVHDVQTALPKIIGACATRPEGCHSYTFSTLAEQGRLLVLATPSNHGCGILSFSLDLVTGDLAWIFEGRRVGPEVPVVTGGNSAQTRRPDH